MRMVSTNDLTAEEGETIRNSKESSGLMTANGTAFSSEEATVYVNDSDKCIDVQLLEHQPSMLSR